jgi:hypothetical protein
MAGSAKYEEQCLVRLCHTLTAMLDCPHGPKKESQEEFDQVEENWPKEADTAQGGETPEEAGEKETSREEGGEKEGPG